MNRRGAILGMLIHDIDLARWCFGELARAFARGLTYGDVNDADLDLLTARFEYGAIGHLEGSWAFPSGDYRTCLETAGDDGLLEVGSMGPLPISVTLKHKDASLTDSVPVSGSLGYPSDDPDF